MITKTITIPSSMNELTLEQFCEALQLVNNPDYKLKNGNVKESFWFEYIHILTRIPKEDLDEMSFEDYQKIKLKIIDFKFDIPQPIDPSPEEKKEIIVEHKGKRFILQPDFGYQKLKTAKVIEDMLGDKDFLEHLYIVAGIVFQELDENNNPKPFILENLDKRSEFWLDCTLDKLYSSLFFCSIQDKSSSMLINRFGIAHPSTKQWIQALLQQGVLQELKRSEQSGDGQELLLNYKKTKFSGLLQKNNSKH